MDGDSRDERTVEDMIALLNSGGERKRYGIWESGQCRMWKCVCHCLTRRHMGAISYCKECDCLRPPYPEK